MASGEPDRATAILLPEMKFTFLLTEAKNEQHHASEIYDYQ
jgi:hypothetical protein